MRTNPTEAMFRDCSTREVLHALAVNLRILETDALKDRRADTEERIRIARTELAQRGIAA